MYTKQNALSFFSQSGTQSNSMVNEFGDCTASGPGNLQVAKRVSLRTMRMKYSKAIRLDLHLIDCTRMQMAYLLPPFVIMMERYMYWTMLLRWGLAIGMLKRIQ